MRVFRPWQTYPALVDGLAPESSPGRALRKQQLNDLGITQRAARRKVNALQHDLLHPCARAIGRRHLHHCIAAGAVIAKLQIRGDVAGIGLTIDQYFVKCQYVVGGSISVFRRTVVRRYCAVCFVFSPIENSALRSGAIGLHLHCRIIIDLSLFHYTVRAELVEARLPFDKLRANGVGLS